MEDIMKSVSIIGANSYIAKNLIHIIRKEYTDIELFLYDREADTNGNSYHGNNFHGNNYHEGDAVNYAAVNILDAASVAKINFSVDAVIVFAGKTGTLAGFDDCRTFVEVNEIGLLNILNAMRSAKSTAKLIFPSTRLVYKGQGRPVREDDEKEFKTLYAMNKYACEQYLKMYSQMFGIRYCVFRICVPYGSLLEGVSSYGTAEFFVTRAKEGRNISLYGRGEVKRTLTYIGDVCRIMLSGAFSEDCLNEVYNIGGEEYSLCEMAQAIAGIYHVGVEFTPWPEDALTIESGSTVFDSGRLDAILGRKYSMTFKEWIGGVL